MAHDDIPPAPHIERGMYQHFKGSMYRVVGVAYHSETLEWYVVYESQNRKAAGLEALCIRPYDMFVEEVTRDGITQPRFRKVSE